MRNLFCPAMLLVALVPVGCVHEKTSEPVFQPVPEMQADSTPAIPSPVIADKPVSATPADKPVSATPADKPISVTPVEGLNGKVSSANANLKFVVLTFPVGQMARNNQQLSVYRGDLKVGELNVTGPQRDDSIVADITAGEAQVGDTVRER